MERSVCARGMQGTTIQFYAKKRLDFQEDGSRARVPGKVLQV